MGQLWWGKRSPNNDQRTHKTTRKSRLLLALIFGLVVLPMALQAKAETARTVLAPLKNSLPFSKQSFPKPKKSPQLALNAEGGSTQLPALPSQLAKPVHDADAPSLLALLAAEFAADRDDLLTALALYKQESAKPNAAAVFERALGLSLQLESATESLSFAKSWQDNNQDHIPVWFYVTHLAIKAGDYETAVANLNMILDYDPNADLGRIFEGILPSDREALAQLAHALQTVNSDHNASLSALKAGLFAQLGEHKVALLWANQAIAIQPKNLAFLTLKADMLQGTQQFAKLQQFLSNAIKRTTGDTQKQLSLYQIRHLIDNHELKTAWRLLKVAHKRFADDPEIALLASLVGLDVKAYDEAGKILLKLTEVEPYKAQAHYYLGIAYERQNQIVSAMAHFAQVDDPEWLMNAQKKLLTHHLNAGELDKALGLLVALRQNHTSFASESYRLQADILVGIGQVANAKTLLAQAVSEYPDDSELLFASSRLLDDEKEYGQKLDNFIHLQQLEPYNPRYQFEQARLILLKNPKDKLALNDIIKVSELGQNHPDYDANLHQDVVLFLARHDLRMGNFNAVINRLSSLYDHSPNLPMGELLLRAYYGLGNQEKVNVLLSDLLGRFGRSDSHSVAKPIANPQADTPQTAPTLPKVAPKKDKNSSQAQESSTDEMPKSEGKPPAVSKKLPNFAANQNYLAPQNVHHP